MNPIHESWQQGWNIVGWTMLYFLAAGTVVLLLGGVLRVLVRRANPSIRYATSLATFTALALLPLGIATQISAPEFTTKITKDTKVEFTQASRGVLDPGWAPGVKASRKRERPELFAVDSIPAQPARVSLETWLNLAVTYLPWLWLVGSPLTFLLLATGVVGTQRLRSSSQLLTTGPIHQACAELRVALGIGRQVGVAICESVAAPLLVGIVRPLVLLPAAALGWPADQLEMVLLHELAHVRRWDNAVNLAQRIVESLLFFHPAIWITSTWVRRDREECCDAVVVGQTAKPQAYAELLLALASPTPLAGLASSALAQHPVAIRIRRILKLEDESMLVSRKSFTLFTSGALALVLTACFLIPSDAEEPTTKGTNDTNEKLTTEGEKSNPLFPSLEEQKAADFAYKLLGIELEKLSPKELQLVKEKGYAGGLRVASGIYGDSPFRDPISTGDLLVGLHVWPTESLAQVEEILSRDDLQGLPTLKYYVLNNLIPHGVGGYVPEPSGEYHLVTGRVAVNFAAWASLEEKKRLEQAREEAVEDSSADELRYDGKTFEEWKAAWRSDLSPDRRIEAVKAFVAFANDTPGKLAVEEIMAIVADYDWEILNDNRLTTPLKEACVAIFEEGQISKNLALEAIVQALDSKNPRLPMFCNYVLEAMARCDEQAKKVFQEKFPDRTFEHDRVFGGGGGGAF